MLNGSGLNFQPEFVAKIVTHRLNIAMFGLFQEEKLSTKSEQYQPFCTWDFGENRAFAGLDGPEYRVKGTMFSQGVEESRANNRNSVVGYCKQMPECYQMTDGGLTPSLGTRFREYLQYLDTQRPNFSHRDIRANFSDMLNSMADDEQSEEVKAFSESVKAKFQEKADWLLMEKTSPLLQLPPSMMFLAGLQFGQINGGSWNLFTLAAKNYLALQSNSGAGSFYWKGGKQPENSDLLNDAFGELIGKIVGDASFGRVEEDVDVDQVKAFMGRQFELAICAYYAMNQEILSRVNFEGNNRERCQIREILRLEDSKALLAMDVLHEAAAGTYSIGNDAIQSNIARPVIVSCSASEHVKSLDKAKDFPPPIRIITKYEDVHHAHVFGSHLFNVDFVKAARTLPSFLSKEKRSESEAESNISYHYDDGCPFFKNAQREFLLLPSGLTATIEGIVASADTPDKCYVLRRPNEGEGSNVDLEVLLGELNAALAALQKAEEDYGKLKGGRKGSGQDKNLKAARKNLRSITENASNRWQIRTGFCLGEEGFAEHMIQTISLQKVEGGNKEEKESTVRAELKKLQAQLKAIVDRFQFTSIFKV
jgi:hypothetical protein